MVNDKQTETTVNKVKRLVSVYEKAAEKDRYPLKCEICETKAQISFEENYREIKCGEIWGGEFSYARFRLSGFPETKEEPLFLLADSGAVESTVFIDGVPYGMFDSVKNAADPEFRLHKYLRLPKKFETVVVEGYSGHTFRGTMPYDSVKTFPLRTLERERTFEGFFAVTFAKEVCELLKHLHLLVSMYDCEKDSFKKANLQKVFEKVFAVLPAMPNENSEPEAVYEASKIIESALKRKTRSFDKTQVFLIGHSHLDTAWLWPIAETRRKAVRTAATAVRLLKRYDGYKFVMSSVLHLEWIKKDYPELFSEIKALEKEKRFEINGATYVECDCNLTGAESLCRQFVRGQKFMTSEFGHKADCFWLPDTFGYSASLPQIMKLAGVNYFLTTKLRWNDTNLFPYDTFYWTGIDGTSVLTHFNTIQSYADPMGISRAADGITNKRLSCRTLLSYGFGDGGGGPDEKMVEYALECETLANVRNCAHSTVSDFMQVLDKDSGFPEYKGELYLELHRGTYTGGFTIKRLNVETEFALHTAEFITAALSKTPAEHKAQTDLLYDRLLTAQFHDLLPGTAITEAMTEAENDLAAVVREAKTLCYSLICKAAEKDKDYLSFINTFGVGISQTVNFSYEIEPDLPRQSYLGFDGEKQTAVRLELPPYSARAYRKTDVQSDAASLFNVTLCKNKITKAEAPLFTVVFDEAMRIVSFVDKRANREIAKGKLNEIRCAENVPYRWDNWDIDADYKLKENVCEAEESKVVCDGSLELRIRSTYKVGKHSQLLQDIVLYADEVRIDFENKLTWQDSHEMLKAYFDTDILTDTVRSGTQFGYIDRSVNVNTEREQAQFEFCYQNWNCLSENAYSVVFASDVKYGASCRKGQFGFTLQCGGTHPDVRANKGTQYFVYSVSCVDAPFSADTFLPSLVLRCPPMIADGKTEFSSFVSFDKPNVIAETVKISENGSGTVIRVWECQRSFTHTLMRTNKEYTVYECDLNEENLNKLNKGSVTELVFRPFEIKTLLLAEE